MKIETLDSLSSLEEVGAPESLSLESSPEDESSLVDEEVEELLTSFLAIIPCSRPCLPTGFAIAFR